MKSIILRPAVGMALAAAVAIGSSGRAADVAGPEYIGTFEAVISGKRIDLERQTVKNVTKVFGLGYGGAKSFSQVLGERSPLRLDSTQPISFVVRVKSQAKDPQEQLMFARAEVKNGKRRAKLQDIKVLGKSGDADQTVPFKAVKFGVDFFKLTPLSKLSQGEYILLVRPTDIADYAVDSQTAYMFGVDN